MILAHLIVGLMPIEDNQFSLYWFLGSVVPDIDHLFVLGKHHIYKVKKIFDSMEHEMKYHIHYRTIYGHSVLGAIIASLIVALISVKGALFFFFGYIVHLLLDWPDVGEKQYLFPLKIKFKGFLPIFSDFEKVFTAVMIGILVFLKLK